MAEPSSAQCSEIGSGDKSASAYNFVTVLACGYRQIRIPKSGLNFPTFLLSLPNQQTAVWQSKRDLLLLGRVASPRPFPKAAFKKGAGKASWRLPNFYLPSFCSEPTNHYHVSMKKSLMQLDQFLQSIQLVAAASGTKAIEVQEAWDIFCRPGDMEDGGAGSFGFSLQL
jgi:hypothetical protein